MLAEELKQEFKEGYDEESLLNKVILNKVIVRIYDTKLEEE